MMQHTIGIDVGTSGVKAVLVDEQGRLIHAALQEYPLYSPYPLWSEQDPADWWNGSLSAVRRLVAESGVGAHTITAIGLTGQMHGAVFLDADQRVLRRAILWNDQRTAEQCAQITRGVGAEKLIAIAGNPALTGFQAPKILWLRQYEPALYARLDKVLLPKDYVRYQLTGEFATDCSDAAGTLLLDLRQRDWSAELLSALDIRRAWLPQVYEGSQVTGRLQRPVAQVLGLPEGIPVVAGGGDNAAAAVGTGIVRQGAVSSSIGTSGVVFAFCEGMSFDPAGRLHTFCHAVPGKNHLMAVTLSAGHSLRWLRDILRVASPDPASLGYAAMTGLAGGVPVGSEGLLFLPYLSGERTPHLDPLASGAFIGLTSRHTAAHLVRAVMEGVVYSLMDGLEIMRSLGVPVEQVRAIGGGAKSPLWCQMQADVFGCEVVTLQVEEGPAYGAALLAMAADMGAEGVSAISERSVLTREKRQPDPTSQALYRDYYSVYQQMYPALNEQAHRLTGIAMR